MIHVDCCLYKEPCVILVFNKLEVCTMMVAIFCVIFIVVAMALLISTSNSDKAKKQEAEQNKTIETSNIVVSNDYKYYHSGSVFRFVIDESHEMVYCANASGELLGIPFSSIIGCEIIQDSVITGGVGRAVVGGVIAGGSGAIVGATTAKTKVSSYKVVLYLSNLSKPELSFQLIDYAIGKDNDIFQRAQEFSEKINASVKAIIAINEEKSSISRERSKQADRSQTNNQTMDEETRLNKLNVLLQKKLITQEEYNRKRDEILSEI